MRRVLCCILGALYLVVAPLAPAIDLYLVADPSAGGVVYPNSPFPLTGLTSGQQVAVYASPNAGYRFDRWFTPGGATLSSIISASPMVMLTGPPFVTVAARFVSTMPVYSLTVTNDGNGATSPSGTTSNIIEGTVKTISATPNAVPVPGYVFDRWTPSAGIANPNAASTIIIVDNNKTIAALFKRLCSLTVDDPAGPGSATYTTNKVAGASVTVAVPSSVVGTATNFRYRCSGWTGGSGSIPATGAALNYGPFTNSTNSTIQWTWLRQYPVSIVSGPGGTTVPLAGVYWYDEGSVLTLTAVVAAGNDFVNWAVGSNITTEASITLTINAPLNAVVIFAHKAAVTTSSGPNW